jgi:hypothetical protein
MNGGAHFICESGLFINLRDVISGTQYELDMTYSNFMTISPKTDCGCQPSYSSPDYGDVERCSIHVMTMMTVDHHSSVHSFTCWRKEFGSHSCRNEERLNILRY